MPGDYEAQTGQGAITYHSEEHLASSDRGVSMVRRVLKQQIDAVGAGTDPMGVVMDASAGIVRTHAGNYLVEDESETRTDPGRCNSRRTRTKSPPTSLRRRW